MNDREIKSLFAEVERFINISEILPALASKNLMAVDIQIVRGNIRIGDFVQLKGDNVDAKTQVVGIETLPGRAGPSLTRIHCVRPECLAMPDGAANGWYIFGT